MAALTKRQAAMIRRLRALLDIADPMFCGDRKIRERLGDPLVRLYFESWVLPELRKLEGANPDPITGDVPVIPAPAWIGVDEAAPGVSDRSVVIPVRFCTGCGIANTAERVRCFACGGALERPHA